MPSSTYDSMCPLPPVRRVVTGHDNSGKAIVLRDTVQPPTFWSPGSGAVYELHRTNESPPVIDTELSKGEWIDEIERGPKGAAGLISENGSTIRAFDFPPGKKVPLHRTVSLDYGIVTKGSIMLTLDDGKEVKLNEGDVIVQRGTIHSWWNDSATEWARVYFVVLDARPVEVNGRKLTAEFRQA